jgi:hypothetical protein
MATCRFNVQVQPKARAKEVSVIDGETLQVRVTAMAEGGKANAAVEEALAGALDLPKSGVQLVAGFRSRRKVVELQMAREAVLAQLGWRAGP